VRGWRVGRWEGRQAGRQPAAGAGLLPFTQPTGVPWHDATAGSARPILPCPAVTNLPCCHPAAPLTPRRFLDMGPWNLMGPQPRMDILVPTGTAGEGKAAHGRGRWGSGHTVWGANANTDSLPALGLPTPPADEIMQAYVVGPAKARCWLARPASPHTVVLPAHPASLTGSCLLSVAAFRCTAGPDLSASPAPTDNSGSTHKVVGGQWA